MSDDPLTPPPADEWLPAETWLVGGSLALGLVLLGVLWWVSKTYFPAGGVVRSPSSTGSVVGDLDDGIASPRPMDYLVRRL